MFNQANLAANPVLVSLNLLFLDTDHRALLIARVEFDLSVRQAGHLYSFENR